MPEDKELSLALRRSAAALSTLMTLIACSSDTTAPANGDWDIGNSDCRLSSAPSGASWNGCAVHWSKAERTATVTLTSTATPETLVFRTNDGTATTSSASALAMVLIPANGAPPQPLSGSLAVTLSTIGSRSLTFSARLQSVVDTATSQPVTGSIALQAGDDGPSDSATSGPGNSTSGVDGGAGVSCTATAQPIQNMHALAGDSEGPGMTSYYCPTPSAPPANCGTYCAYGEQTCCELQGHPELSCPIGSYCTSDGKCAGSAACGPPVGLGTKCTTSEECSQRNPYLFCDTGGQCKVRDGQDCFADSWCAAGSTCQTRCGQYIDNPIIPPSSSPYPCMCAYGGTTNVYTQTCPTGSIACNDPARSCCPATSPYFINGNCYADPYPACEANGGQCPIRCGN